MDPEARCPKLVPSQEKCNSIHRFLANKVKGIREETLARTQTPELAALSTISLSQYSGPALMAFKQVTVDQVNRALHTVTASFSSLDMCPSSIITEHAEFYGPHFLPMFNESLRMGIIPDELKESIILPILKNRMRTTG